MPARILAGDQNRQLERIGQADAQKLPRRRLGHSQVAALDCPPEDAQRMALRGRRSSSPGPDDSSILIGCVVARPTSFWGFFFREQQSRSHDLNPSAPASRGLYLSSAMALRDQRHPIRTGAEGVELLEGEADDLETAVLTALTDEMALVGTELGGQLSDFIVRDPQELLVLIHPDLLCSGASGSVSRKGAGFQGRTDGLCFGKGQVLI